MSSASAPKTVAFIGATGGCANTALALALKNGSRCIALARTPSRLTDMLLAAGVSQAMLDAQLEVVQGNAKELAPVKQLLGGGSAGVPVDILVTGVGATPKPGGWDSQVCRETASRVLEALDELRPAVRPHICSISTTGISDGPRDVPAMMSPLYSVALRAPHKDKRAVEDSISQAYDGAKNPAFSGYTLVRPTLLTDGLQRGLGNVRVGSVEKPELGYTISRKDVGLWIYENIIRGDAARWNQTRPTLCY